MADYERLLLAKVIREQDMAGLVDAKIGLDFFVDDEHREVFKELQEHWQKYGSPMSESALKADRPQYKLPATPEPLQYYIDRIRQAYKHDVIAHAVQDAVGMLDDLETDEALQTLTAAVNDVSGAVSPLKDHNLTDPVAFDRLFDFYAKLTEDPGALRGFATGWETLDLATMGLQAGQLVTFVGPPKAGKSTVMLAVADYINKTALKGYDTGVDVLLVSFEMSYDEQVARWVGINGRLNYRRLLKGKMNDFDEKRLNRVLKQLQKGRAPFILSEDVSSTTTVSGIIAKVQQHRPKVLFIDGVYLMDDENGEPKGSAQAITNITRSLKRVAQVFGIPVVISTQTLLSKMRGQSIKTNSIGYSSSFGQDSDTVIAIEPRDNDDSGDKEVWLKVLLSRSGPLVEVQIEFDWNTSTFTEYAADWADHDDPDEQDDGEMRSA